MTRGELIAEYPERHLQGTSLHYSPDAGWGTREFYRLDRDLYVVAVDSIRNFDRVELLPGEGLLEFTIWLSGVMDVSLPDGSKLEMSQPLLYMMYQPPGVDISVRIRPKSRNSLVSLFCRPSFFIELARRNHIDGLPMISELETHSTREVWYRKFPLSTTLSCVARSMLDNPYSRGVRLLHAEAKALELLCDVLASAEREGNSRRDAMIGGEARQLDVAHRILTNDLSSPKNVEEIARTIGMSESKFKRTFKRRFGKSVGQFRLSCRMHSALELLRGRHLTVGQVAHLVGYRHQTTFATSFSHFFGFPPNKARVEID